MGEPSRKIIKSIADFMEWIAGYDGRNMLYRGLSNAEYGVDSSLLRRLKIEKNDAIPRDQFKEAIKRLLNDAEMRGHRQRNGNALRDLELLAELQHYGAATCLIDFTKMPLVALWFACQSESDSNGKSKSDSNGKIVAIDSGDSEQFIKIWPGTLRKTIEELLPPKDEKTDKIINKFWVWDPHHQNNRITAQRSVFVFGDAPEVPTGDDGNICIVAKEAKAKIIRGLRQHGVSEESLFCDFDGFARLNAHDKPYPHLSAKDYFDLGQESATAEKYESAIAYYDIALRGANPYKPAYFYRGISKLLIEDYQGAADDFTEAIKLDDKNAEAHYYRGIAKANLGDHTAAIADYDKTIAINPQHAEAYINRGIVKANLGDHTAAIADYDEAEKRELRSAELYFYRGNVKARLGDHTAAIADYDKTIAINPQHAEAHYYRGNAKGRMEQYQAAIADYDKTIAINPQHAEAYINRGVAKNNLDGYNAAIADYDQAIKLNPEYADTYYNRGVAKARLGEHTAAVADFSEAIKLNPEYANAYYNRGVAKLALDDKAGALKDFRRANELDPETKIPEGLEDESAGGGKN